jgi:hypothetical protein
MSSDLIKLANLYIIKVALSRDVRPYQLTFLSPEDQTYIAQMGTSYDFPNHPNPPPWVADPAVWKRAKKIVKKHWRRYNSPYSIVSHIYENMGGKIKKKKHKS